MSSTGSYTEVEQAEPKTSQNKGFNESYNGSARVTSLCTFRNQPLQNKQVHHGGIIFVKRFLDEFSCSLYLSTYK